jgi:3-oxoacyl-[acyl-carrier-protein] synthase III
MRAAITAVAGYLPEYVLTNHELEAMVDTTDEWIRDRTGITERRILREGRCSSDMGAEAVTELLRKRGIGPETIDMVICATVTPDMLFPATANIVSYKCGLKNAWGYDVEAACGSFLFSLVTGAQFIETGRCKRIIVLGTDKMSSIVDYSDRNTCIIFGDGAGAVLLEADEADNGLIDWVNHMDGTGIEYLHMKAGGSLKPPSIDTVHAREHVIYQEGKHVFKAAVTGMADATVEIMARNQLQADQIAYLVPHQANKRIIDATRERMGLPVERVMVNIERYGNTTSATIPLCLRDWEHKLRRGDNLILAAFGGGFTWGAAYLRWAYDGSPAAA